jgi:HEAT repeat protein
MKRVLLCAFFILVFTRSIFAQNDEEKIKKLITELKSSNPLKRKIAARRLLNYGDKIKRFSREVVALIKFYDIRNHVTQLLRNIGAREIVKLLGDEELYIRMNTLEALLILQAKEFAHEIAELLKDKNIHVRGFAARVLGWLKAKEYAKEIAKLLKDKDNDVRYYAVGALGELKAEECADELFELLEELIEKNVDGDLPNAVICTLGYIGSKKYIKTIAKLLKHPYPSYRIAAVRALGLLDAKEYVNNIAELLKDQDKYVRWYTAYVLGSIGTCKVLELLKEQLEKESCCDVRRTIKDAIRKIKEKK